MATTDAPATNPALQQLVDIQEPALGNDWYMAPVWWIAFVLIVVVVVFALRLYQRRQQQQAPRRFALANLARITPETPDAAHQITALLKRLLLTQAPSHPALGYSGEAWQQYLCHSLAAQYQRPLPDLLALHYQQQPAVEDIALYASFAQQWLQHANYSVPAPTTAVAGGAKHV